MVFFIFILLIILLAGAWLYINERNRQQMVERLMFGFASDDVEETSLWDGADNLLQLTAIRDLLLRSALIRWIDLITRRARFRLSLMQSLALLVGLSLAVTVVMYFVYKTTVVTVASLLVTPALVCMVWRMLAENQQRKMDLQLPSLINSMLTTMRAGGTPIQALQATSRNAENPMRESIGQVLQQLQIGQSPIMVWKEWSDFWDTKPCRLLSTGIRVKWEAGGQMTSVLEHILESIEFRKKIQQRIETLTTQAKFGSILLSVIPPFLLYLQYKVRPELVIEMIEDPVGKKIYIAAAVLTVIGFFWLRRMARIKME